MTTACLIFLSISLVCYLIAALLFQGHFFLRKPGWHSPGVGLLLVGMAVHGLGLLLHFAITGQSPFSSMLVIVSLLVLATLTTVLLIERFFRLHIAVLITPLAFLGLLYPTLMPLRFEAAESILLQYPWLGIHVVLSMLGLVGFALAACTASAYLVQARMLRRGRLNSFLPALDAASNATYHFAVVGFSIFSFGLGMGIIWLFGAPGEHLAPRDTKIWLALPTWLLFAGYLYLRGVAGRHESRLKWLVIVGFLFAAANMIGVRHDFTEEVAKSSADSRSTIPMAEIALST